MRTKTPTQVGAVIYGGRDSSHLDGVLPMALQLTLSETDLAEIAAAIKELKPLNGDVYGLERVKNGVHARIMKYALESDLSIITLFNKALIDPLIGSIPVLNEFPFYLFLPGPI